MIRASVEALVSLVGSKINIAFYAKKKQFKVFVTIAAAKTAIQFFETVFTMKSIIILDPASEDLCEREMRAYLVKTEGEFQALAMRKYTLEMQKNSMYDSAKTKSNESSGGRGRGRGSGSNRGKRGGFNSMEEFSHSSGLGGSAGSEVY